MAIVFRIIGLVMAVGFTAMLVLLWITTGMPVNLEDWIACIGINMMLLFGITFGVVMAVID
jgi:hypothetical protein